LINPLIDFILPSFHQKLFEKWCENIYHAIIELEKKKISKIELLEDKEFISLLKECISIASKTHQIEKHELLKRILINHFENDFSFDSKLMFTKLVDTLTLSHFSLLFLLNKHFKEIKEIEVFKEIVEILNKDSLIETIPVNSYRMLLHDLEKLNLIATGALKFKTQVKQPFVMSAGGEDKTLPFILITDFGKDFIKYLETN
jgi:hypothetical protein